MNSGEIHMFLKNSSEWRMYRSSFLHLKMRLTSVFIHPSVLTKNLATVSFNIESTHNSTFQVLQP